MNTVVTSRAHVVGAVLVAAAGGLACGRGEPAAAARHVSAPNIGQLTAKGVPLPGAHGNAFLDYIAYERGARRVWVPVGSTGSVDVLDIASGRFTLVEGFKTVEREARGAMRTIGPSAVALGDGVAYIGNRGTNEVCAVDTKTLRLGGCLQLHAAIDGVAYVASSKEVWVTAPKATQLIVLDASTPERLGVKGTIQLAGEPEGYAVDESRGTFFTNLEDKGGTVVIDVKARAVRATWNAGCGEDGPRGLAVDEARNRVFVACTDHVQLLDAAHDGAKLGTLDAGAGVDNIDWLPGKRLLYVASGKAARLTVVRADDAGRLEIVAVGATAPGARNAVADENGNAYVADSQASRILVLDAHAPMP